VLLLIIKKQMQDHLTVEAACSGYCLGSTNWIFKGVDQRILLLGMSSNARALHPKSIELNCIKECQTIVVKSLLVDKPRPSLEEVFNGICYFIGIISGLITADRVGH